MSSQRAEAGRREVAEPAPPPRPCPRPMPVFFVGRRGAVPQKNFPVSRPRRNVLGRPLIVVNYPSAAAECVSGGGVREKY